MTRARDAGLAGSLLAMAILFGLLHGASVEPIWLLGGVLATVVAEGLAYRRAETVQELFDGRTALLVTAAVGGAAIGAGIVFVPDRSLSVALGALGSYLSLLAAAEFVDRTMAEDRLC